MNNFNVPEMIGKLGLIYVPFLFALCFHEFAHGWVAKKKGDNTAELMGRLSMNPLVHVDILGTVILPIMAILVPGGVFFGWAKPVPVNPRNLKDVKRDMFWIAIAGPLSNVILAFLGTIGIVITFMFFREWHGFEDLKEMMMKFIQINLFLAVFNMIPLHPLDGGKVLARFLPHNANVWLEENQGTLQIVLIVCFVAGFFRYLAYPVMWIQKIMLALVLGLFNGF